MLARCAFERVVDFDDACDSAAPASVDWLAQPALSAWLAEHEPEFRPEAGVIDASDDDDDSGADSGSDAAAVPASDVEAASVCGDATKVDEID